MQDLGAAMGVNPVRIYRSTDSGRTWSPLARTAPGPEPGTSGSGLPVGCDKTGIAFANQATGWLTEDCASPGSSLLVSRDGGLDWAPQALPAAGPTGQPGDCEVSTPQFFGRTGFLSVGHNAASAGLAPSASLLASRDTGATWRALPLPAGAGSGPKLQFFGARRGLLLPAGAGALRRVLYRTADAGATWTAVRQGRSFRQLGVTFDFVSPSAGFAWIPGTDATRGAPAIYATTDSGRTWTSFTPLG